jgi:pyruvate/oxaloacetate carboxyltransferase
VSRKKLGFIDSTLRDGQELLVGGRLRAELVAPILESLDAVGFESIEGWGGGTFRSSLALLHQDPWQTLRALKKKLKRTPLQIHLRGRFLVGDRPFSYGFVERFLNHTVELGVDVARLVDPLNDLESLTKVAHLAKKAGLIVQVSVLCAESLNDFSYYENLIKKTDLSDADAIGIFDPWGTLSPATAMKVVELLQNDNEHRVFAHLHSLSGTNFPSIASFVEEGVSVIDTCFSAFSFAGSLPSIEAVYSALDADNLSGRLDLEAIVEVSNAFERLSNAYFDRVPAVMEPMSLQEKSLREIIPTLSLLMMKRISRASSLEDDGLRAETMRIMKELGLVALVAPVSETVVRQAVLNLHSTERYAEFTEEFVRLLRSKLGKVRIQKDLTKLVRNDLEPQISNEIEEVKEHIIMPPDLGKTSEEEILSFELYPHELMEAKQANVIARRDGREEVVAAALALIAERDSVARPLELAPSNIPIIANSTRWRDAFRVDNSGSARKRGFVQEPF